MKTLSLKKTPSGRESGVSLSVYKKIPKHAWKQKLKEAEKLDKLTNITKMVSQKTSGEESPERKKRGRKLTEPVKYFNESQ